MDKQPTQEQIKEFWKYYGLVWVGDSPQLKVANSCEAVMIDKPICGWYSPDYLKGTSKLISLRKTPVIDLNNLFKYAVPKMWMCNITLEEGIFWNVYVAYPTKYKSVEGKTLEEDLTLALFWALWQVKEADSGI